MARHYNSVDTANQAKPLIFLKISIGVFLECLFRVLFMTCLVIKSLIGSGIASIEY